MMEQSADIIEGYKYSSEPVGSERDRKRTKQRSTSVFRRLGTTVSYIVLTGLAAFSLLPILVMIATSLKPKTEIFQIPPRLFSENMTLDNYVNVFTQSSMPTALMNSILVALMVSAITLIIGGTSGYAIARLRFKGSAIVSIGLLMGQLLPATVLLLPLFQLVSKMKLLDTLVAVAITHLTIVLPLVTWMAISIFEGVPVELEQAALIDGCSQPKAVLLVILPVVAPGIIALSIFAFLQSWNEFVFASVITRSSSSKTAPVALTDFAGQFEVDWGATTAAATVIAIPLTIAFMFVQRHFISGMSAGAVKG